MSVFANGMEVSGKATPNKTIAAMPDVCLSPPPPPAGPVPLPYPMTGMASDTTDGCTSVIVKGKEAGKKNSTKYSKTMGNEPATNSFGANVISHKLSGALKFAAYSFDVIFEGGGACRFGDLTTQNHMNIGGGSTSADIGGLAPPKPPEDADCKAMRLEVEAQREKLNASTSDRRAKKGTISSFKTSNGESLTKASNALMRKKLNMPEVSLATLPPAEPGKGHPSKVCGGGAHHHPTQGNCNHTEAQAVDSISWSPAPKTITMVIDYPALQDDNSINEEMKNWPCGACKRVLKKACDCGVQILICLYGQKQDFCKNQEKPKGG